MKITLNLATRPYADHGPAMKQLRIGMAVLAVVLLGLGWGLLHFHQAALSMAAREDAIDRSIAQIDREEQGYQRQMQQPANAKVLTQAGFLNQLFDEKSFSWTATMEDLEPVLPAGVQVTSIEPVREKNGDLTLHLRISGPRERSVETIRNMEHSRRFVAPRIAGENSENSSSQGNLKPVSAAGKVTFEVLAEYNQATLDERKAAMGQEKRAHQNPTGAAAAAALPVPLRPAGIPRGPLNLPANANNPVRQPSQMPAGQPFSGPGIPPRPGPRGQNPALLPNGMPNPNPTPGGPQ